MTTDDRGRIVIPKSLRNKYGVDYELYEEDGKIILNPILIERCIIAKADNDMLIKLAHMHQVFLDYVGKNFHIVKGSRRNVDAFLADLADRL